MTLLLTGYGRLIRNRRYFPLWLGQLISNLGDTLHYIALVVWVYERTGSSLAVSGAVFFEVVPVVLLAPVAGIVIDRFSRKTILVTSDMLRAVLVLMLLLTTELWQMVTIHPTHAQGRLPSRRAPLVREGIVTGSIEILAVPQPSPPLPGEG